MRSSSPARKTVRSPPPESPAQPRRSAVDVGPGREIIERPLVLGREDAGPGRPRAEEALGDDVLVVARERVVRHDLRLGFGALLLQVLLDHGRASRPRGPAGCRTERRRGRARHTRASPARWPMRLRRSSSPGAPSSSGADRSLDAGDLARPEVLVAAVIVQREDAGEPPLALRRLEEQGLGGRAVGKLPLQVLDRDAVVLELVLELGLGGPAGRRLQEIEREAPPWLRVSRLRGPQTWGFGTRARPGPSGTSEAAHGPYAPSMFGSIEERPPVAKRVSGPPAPPGPDQVGIERGVARQAAHGPGRLDPRGACEASRCTVSKGASVGARASSTSAR